MARRIRLYRDRAEYLKRKVAERRDLIRCRLIAYKGGRCEKCGYDRCQAALEFHHIDPTVKEFGLNKSLTLSWKRMKAEADKCRLLCANCHREVANGAAAVA